MAGVDEQSAEFAKKVDEIILHGFIAMNMAIGSHQGLFDVMATLDKPATAAVIAEKAGCKERYVREWLCAMSVSKIVEVSDDGAQFYLPEHHRYGLTSGDHMVSSWAKCLPLLPNSHQPLMAAFKKDGPPGFDLSYVEPLRLEQDKQMLKKIDLIGKAISETAPDLKQKLESGVVVCEIGPSVGNLLEWMGKKFPKSQFTGADISERAANDARIKFKEAGLTNVTMTVADAGDMPSDLHGKFDVIYMRNVFHDLPLPTKSAEGMYRILKPGGILTFLDPPGYENPKDNIGCPQQNINYTFSMYNCLSTALNCPGSEGLGVCPGREKVTRILQSAGFKDVDVKLVSNSWLFTTVKPE